jgi:LysM repeat protein
MNALIFFFILVGVGFSTPTKASDGEIYVVRKGDTLSEIALKYLFFAPELCLYNEIQDCNKIFPGQEIRIPSRKILFQGEKELVVSQVEPLQEQPTRRFSTESSYTNTLEKARFWGKTPPPLEERTILSSIVVQGTEEQRQEIDALKNQITELEDNRNRTNSILQFQRERLSLYSHVLFVSFLGNILFFLLWMKNWKDKKQFTLKEKGGQEVSELQRKMHALEGKVTLLKEQRKILLEKNIFFSLRGERYRLIVEKFELDGQTDRIIPIVSVRISYGKHEERRIFSIKKFEGWLEEDPGRRFQILDPVIVVS